MSIAIPDPPHWTKFAACVQVDVGELFFPEKGGSTREAKLVCSRCDVRQRCLEEAIARDERYGIFGGFSERERRRMKRGDVVAMSIRGPKPKHCASCGEDFFGASNALYCGRLCRDRAKAIRAQKRDAA